MLLPLKLPLGGPASDLLLLAVLCCPLLVEDDQGSGSPPAGHPKPLSAERVWTWESSPAWPSTRGRLHRDVAVL